MSIEDSEQCFQIVNSVTNNVLLLVTKLNEIHPNYYRTMINRLSGSTSVYNSQIQFTQQSRTNDQYTAYVSVTASNLVLETELSVQSLLTKIAGYQDIFQQGVDNRLWHISSIEYTADEIASINEQLQHIYPNISIHFDNLTFLEILENIKSLYIEGSRDIRLKRLYADFKEYCDKARLINKNKYALLCAATGLSYSWNVLYKIYFCPTYWHEQDFAYFGLYNSQAVKSIAEVESVIVADFDMPSRQLTVHSSGHSSEQISRLRTALINYGHSQTGFKYYLLDEREFYQISFKKETTENLQKCKYLDLRDFLDGGLLKSENCQTKDIALNLNGQRW